jgi:monoamine oxidase
MTLAMATSLTRREVLAAAAGMLLVGCGSSGSARPGPRIVIVGAGLAGLTCAYRLGQAGYRAEVYEASSRIGGRAWTLRGLFADGQTAEHGGEFVDSDHADLLTLIRELGLDTIDLNATGPQAPGPLTVVRGRRVTDAALQRAFDEAWPRIAPDAQSPVGVDSISAAEWIDTRIPGGRGSALGAYLDVVWTTESGIDTHQLSASNLAYALSAGGPGRFLPIGTSDERFVIRGGSDTVPHHLTARIGHATIATGVALEAVRRRSDARLLVTLRADQGVRDVIADRLVLALPFTALRRCDLSAAGLSTPKLRAIRSLGMGTNSKLHAQFTNRFWYAAGLDGDSESTTLETTWEETWGRGGTPGILVDYTGGRIGAESPTGPAHGTAHDADTKRFLARLETLMPGARRAFNGLAAVDHWIGDPYTHGSYSGYLVGQWTTIAGTEAPPEGHIHFAGEHTSLLYQGFMNGAVESGNRAAREVITATKRG